MAWLGITFEFLLIMALVLEAKRRRAKCDWDWKKANGTLWWRVVGIVAVTIGGDLVIIETGHGIGITGVILWPCIYWVALATYRKRDLREIAS